MYSVIACAWRFCCCFYYLFYYLLCCCLCDVSKTTTKQIFKQRFGRWLNLVSGKFPTSVPSVVTGFLTAYVGRTFAQSQGK